MTDMRKILEDRIASGVDTALIRFALGKLCLDERHPDKAALHLARAVELDPDYAAAWALLGKAYTAAGEPSSAIEAYRTGILAAERKGELQASRQMRVLLARLEKQTDKGVSSIDGPDGDPPTA